MLKIGANAIKKVTVQKTLTIDSVKDVYVVGDLDGSLSGLQKALIRKGFVEHVDHLICLGDMIDRGSESVQLIQYLSDINADFVLGNHEHLMLESIISQDETAMHLWSSNGGAWHHDVDKAKLDSVCNLFLNSSLSIRLEYRGIEIGLSHTLPPSWNWSSPPEKSEGTVESLLWSRELFKSQKQSSNIGVNFSIHGHNSTQIPIWIGNTYHIDTNYYGRPTVVNLGNLIDERENSKV
ncbi:metallophosphoesterase [Pseudoalteromonas phenolica]|uniref:Metallophosphoesterase n=2 Tax=Pseudoalteromonas phenolica TaxID=161398 RepID=A0A0S2K4S0_9GAMM|nr:metallophosphoesterase [Pseudoalteromonas phenolica]ALO43059.1 metallophosphoesterase [Pseudoalteromonas phenolica]MBE0355791.1 serine/threonine protein phosphatase 1 [Pseudoalteromonas phenolica O-BC30]